jgi:hypothetical protein
LCRLDSSRADSLLQCMLHSTQGETLVSLGIVAREFSFSCMCPFLVKMKNFDDLLFTNDCISKMRLRFSKLFTIIA